MNSVANEAEVYQRLITQCEEMFAVNEQIPVADMAMRLMDNESVPMHCPFHHFIIPATLLTACMKAVHADLAELRANLEEALKRSKIVVGGSCGFYGACGAAVGMGIFMSVFTDTTPMSVESWSWANEATGRCLQEIARYKGPRCCKRVVFITLQEAVPLVREKLNISLPEMDPIHCKYHARNQECKKEACPFYSQEGGVGL
jgi:hypothetical protein